MQTIKDRADELLAKWSEIKADITRCLTDSKRRDELHERANQLFDDRARRNYPEVSREELEGEETLKQLVRRLYREREDVYSKFRELVQETELVMLRNPGRHSTEFVERVSSLGTVTINTGPSTLLRACESAEFCLSKIRQEKPKRVSRRKKQSEIIKEQVRAIDKLQKNPTRARLCLQLDKKRIALPSDVDWYGLDTWTVALKKYKNAVQKWLSDTLA